MLVFGISFSAFSGSKTIHFTINMVCAHYMLLMMHILSHAVCMWVCLWWVCVGIYVLGKALILLILSRETLVLFPERVYTPKNGILTACFYINKHAINVISISWSQVNYISPFSVFCAVTQWTHSPIKYNLSVTCSLCRVWTLCWSISCALFVVGL